MKKQLHEMLGVEYGDFIQLRTKTGDTHVLTVGAEMLYYQCSFGESLPKITKLALKGNILMRVYDHDTREFSGWRKLPNK